MMDTDIDELQEEQQREDKLAAIRRDTDLKSVLSTPSGRRFVWGLMARAGVFQASYTPEPMGLAFNEGRRSVGLSLMGEIVARTPDLFLIMQKENIDDGHS